MRTFFEKYAFYFCLKIICLEVLAISKQELQINEEIRDREILVIDQNGTKLGTMSARDAQKLAYEQDLDLVKIAPQATPPVCRIMDYGKYCFEQQKREKEAKKNQKVVSIKEIRMFSAIDTHDFETKVNQAKKFLEGGDKLKVSVRFRKRAIAHPQLGEELLNRFKEACAAVGTVEKPAKMEGRSMVNVISVASELGYLQIPENTLIEIDQVKNYPDDKVVLITTGSQGESMAALSRMAANIHKKITIKPNDTIIFSSNPIPGNEKAVSKVINELSMKGAKVIFQDVHVSGHACQEEIKLIYSLVKPKYAIPIHGEYRHLTAQKHIVEDLGIPKENILLMSSGDVVEVSQDQCKVVDHVQAGAILVDGLGVGDVGNIVLRDRQNLAQNGIIIVVLTLEKFSNQLLAGPDLVSRGFVYVRESEDLMEEARQVVQDAVQDCLERHVNDWGKIKNIIRDSLSDFLWKKMKRNPMILPIIMEV